MHNRALTLRELAVLHFIASWDSQEPVHDTTVQAKMLPMPTAETVDVLIERGYCKRAIGGRSGRVLPQLLITPEGIEELRRSIDRARKMAHEELRAAQKSEEESRIAAAKTIAFQLGSDLGSGIKHVAEPPPGGPTAAPPVRRATSPVPKRIPTVEQEAATPGDDAAPRENVAAIRRRERHRAAGKED